MTGPKAEERNAAILAGKLDLLFRGHIAVPGNMLAAAVVAYLFRSSYPAWFLMAWLTATIAVGLARLALHRQYLARREKPACQKRWAHRFTLGSFASGTLWGILCGSLALWGTAKEFVLLTFVAGGMTAGALATFSPYMPAYLAYATPFTLPLSVSSLLNRNEIIAGNGVLILLYFAVITLTCRYSSRFVNRTVELQVDNEILRGHLHNTRHERDRARTEKWSTLAQLSHELRTPLNAIMGFSEAMRDEVLGAMGNRRYKDYAQHIHESGRQLLTLSDELILISQGESGELILLNEAPVDLRRVIVSLMACKREAAAKAGLVLESKMAAHLPMLIADRPKLRCMLRHLVDNAIKFTPAGGKVCVTAEKNPDGAITVTIEDTGIGIEPQDVPRALRPFGRVAAPLSNNTSGIGLGLPLAAKLAELHGATLTLESKPNEGTRVTITFPVSRTAAKELRTEQAA